ACDNENKSVESTTTTTEGTNTTGNNVTVTRTTTANGIDTPRTKVNVGPGGTSVSTKNGTNVTIDNKGIKVGGKGVKVDIKTGN
ncbi:MAG: hypothetical protein ABIO05_08975, partial [Ferruginibacter sp.]